MTTMTAHQRVSSSADTQQAKRPILNYLGRLTQIVSLGFTVGSIIAVGAIVAPSVFYNVDRQIAIGVMSIIFSKLATVLLILSGVFVLGTAIRWFSEKEAGLGKQGALRIVLSLFFLGITAYNLLVLTPEMTTMVSLHKNTVQKERFDALHEQSRAMFMGEAISALILIIILL